MTRLRRGDFETTNERAGRMHFTATGSGQMQRPSPQSSLGSETEDIHLLRILLVDDGAETSKTYERLSEGVRTGGYVLDRVTAPQEDFGAMASGDHDVYVVDHHVGTRIGLEFIAWVQAESKQVPIVFVAGSKDHDMGVTAIRSGASRYVVEDSIDSGILEISIRQAVERTKDLAHLNSGGIAIDSGSLTRTPVFSGITEHLRELAASLLDVARRSLKSDLPTSELESFVSIELKANKLLTLANDLYDMSMLDAGRLEFNMATFSLRGLVSNVTQTLATEAGERDVDIIADVSSDVPDTVCGDPGRLRRVIVGFIESIIVRGSTDRVVLSVDVQHRSDEAVTLRFGVRGASTGKVLTDGPLADVEPMASDVTPTRLLDRSVLGMTIALESVSRMGGRVTIDREDGRPSGIQFTLRLEIGEDDREFRPTIDDSAPAEGLILVIADVIDARRSIVETLGEAGLSYLVVPSVEAWTAATNLDDVSALPALAVIDSAVDSFAVHDQFKAVAASVPVVVVVGSGTRGDAASCRERGVRGYLAKPTDPGDLVDVIRSTMGLIAAGDETTLVTRHWLREGRSSLHVLVVDDSTTSRFLLTRMLEQRGHSTTQASDGKEAVEEIRHGSFDVVLMDALMPEMGGLEATRRIRDMQTGTDERTFIIGMSAFADQDRIERAYEAGMDDFLSKPVRLDDLFAVVERTKEVKPAHA